MRLRGLVERQDVTHVRAHDTPREQVGQASGSVPVIADQYTVEGDVVIEDRV
jgi:hypothetical protein